MWSHVPWPLFCSSCFCECLAASVMQNSEKPCVSMETISWVARQDVAVSSWVDLWALCAAVCHVHVIIYEKERGRCVCEKQGWACVPSPPSYTPLFSLSSAFCRPVQFLVQSVSQIAGSCLWLFALSICCHRQLVMLLCPITISAHCHNNLALTCTENFPVSPFIVNTNTQCDIQFAKGKYNVLIFFPF